jgi:hypothetical protein
VWRASSRASLVREYFCDDAVVLTGIQCSTYLKTLLHVAECAENCKSRFAISFGNKTTELILRAQRLVESAKGLYSPRRYRFFGRRTAEACLVFIAVGLAQVEIPTDPTASSRNQWSSWPAWSARCLHCFGITVRDYEVFDRRIRTYEQLHENGAYDSGRLQTTHAI